MILFSARENIKMSSCPTWRGDNKLEMNTAGHMTDPYQSAVRMYDDQGWCTPFTQSPSFRPPIFINVESAARNIDRFPDPCSFELHLDTPLKGVTSLEIVDLYVPNGDSVEPKDGYFFVANGLMDVNSGTGKAIDGTFTPQANGIGRLYKDMKPDETVSPTAPGTWDAPVGLACASFGKFCYDGTMQSQCWERKNARKVHFFRPEVGKIGTLQFSLLQRDAVRYDLLSSTAFLAAEDNWTCTLMVTCRMD